MCGDSRTRVPGQASSEATNPNAITRLNSGEQHVLVTRTPLPHCISGAISATVSSLLHHAGINPTRRVEDLCHRCSGKEVFPIKSYRYVLTSRDSPNSKGVTAWVSSATALSKQRSSTACERGPCSAITACASERSVSVTSKPAATCRRCCTSPRRPTNNA